LDTIVHISGTVFSKPVLKLELEICPRHFGFHPYRSSIKRSFCKAPSGHACKGCWPGRHWMCRCKPNRFSIDIWLYDLWF